MLKVGTLYTVYHIGRSSVSTCKAGVVLDASNCGVSAVVTVSDTLVSTAVTEDSAIHGISDAPLWHKSKSHKMELRRE